MASIQLDIDVATSPEAAWDAVRDFGAVHQRLVPGFLTDSRLDGDDRLVTFFAGAVARERLVSVDDARRRLVYSVVDSPLGATHHQASVEVVDRDGTVLRWITD